MSDDNEALDQGSDSNQSVKSIVLLLALGVIPLVAIIAMTFGVLLRGEPNPRGPTRAQAIDSSPTSPVQNLLQEYTRFAQPETYLVSNSIKLDQLVITLRRLGNGLDQKKEFSDVANKTAIKAQLAEAERTIQLLKEAIADKNEDGSSTYSKYLIKIINQIDRLAANNPNGSKLVEAADTLINYNDNGSGRIPYKLIPQIILDSNDRPTYVDCSAFISYVMYKNKIFRTMQHVTVTGFLSMATKEQRGFKVILKDSSKIPSEKIKAAIADGTIKAGDMFISGSHGNGRINGAHIVMFTGRSGNNAIAHSTTSGGKSGPQYTSLDRRLNQGGHILAVIRAPTEDPETN